MDNLLSSPETEKFLSPIEDIIEDARNGRMFILVDDEERENEGDLIIPAQMATPDVIQRMSCLPTLQQKSASIWVLTTSQYGSMMN